MSAPVITKLQLGTQRYCSNEHVQSVSNSVVIVQKFDEVKL